MKIKTQYDEINARICKLKGLHRLTNRAIGEITGHKENSVSRWFNDPNSNSYNRAPLAAFIKLASMYDEDVEHSFEIN